MPRIASTSNRSLTGIGLKRIPAIPVTLPEFYYPLTNTATDPTSATWRTNNAPAGYIFIPNDGIYVDAPITSTANMFASNSTFNDADIGNWDTSSVTDMNNMFSGATAFTGGAPFERPYVELIYNGTAELSSNGTVSFLTVTGNDSGSGLSFTYNDNLSPTIGRTIDIVGQDAFGYYNYQGKILETNWVSGTNQSDVVFTIDTPAPRVGMVWEYAIETPGSLNQWDVSNVVDMSNMLAGATSFNCYLGDWDVSSVTDMSGMFSQTTTSLGLGLSTWNVSNVTDMSNMFQGSFRIIRPLSSWDVGSVTDMSGMFNNTLMPTYSDFRDWCVVNITTEPVNFAPDSGLPLENYPVWGTCPGVIPSVTSFFGSTGESITVSSSRLSLITTDQARFGTKSLQKNPINGTGDRSNAVNIPLSQTLGAPMTMEAWVWIGVSFADPNFENGPEIFLHGPAVDMATTFPTNYVTLRGLGANTFGITCGTAVSRVPPDGTSASANDQNNGGIPLNTWTHIALSYSDNTNYAVWVNGIRRLRNSRSGGYGLSQVMTQLTVNPSGNVGPHYIDEIRVSNVDRYGVDNTTITVPADEFVSDANTVALVKFNGPKYNGSAWIEQDALGQVSIVSDSYSADGIYTALQSLSVGDTFKWSRPAPNNQQYTATLTDLPEGQLGSPSFYRWFISTVPNPANNGSYPGPAEYSFFIDTIYL